VVKSLYGAALYSGYLSPTSGYINDGDVVGEYELKATHKVSKTLVTTLE
jgi:hypothetical protein